MMMKKIFFCENFGSIYIKIFILILIYKISYINNFVIHFFIYSKFLR